MKNRLAAFGLTATLSLASAGCEFAPQSTNPNAIADSQSPLLMPLGGARLVIADVMQEQGGELLNNGSVAADTTVAILERGRLKSLTCENGRDFHKVRYDDMNALEYCSSGNQIIFGQVALNRLVELGEPRGLASSDIIRFIMAHELGHAQQIHGTNVDQDDLINGVKSVGRSLVELQADCLAGELLATTSPELLNESADMYALFGFGADEFSHGTAKQRTASFDNGARTGDCSTDAIITAVV